MDKPLSDKRLFIFDMDGTIYLGGRVFPAAVDYISRLRRDGRRVLFFTNNASHSPDFYIEKLTRLGFDPQPGELLTSADVTLAFLKSHRSGKSVYLVGTPELEGQFAAAGVVPVSTAEVLSGAHADIVVTSFDTTLTYDKLNAACRLIRGGAEYICTHPDYNCPTEDGFIPDSGAIAAAVTASTGVKPRFFGKPYRETIEMIAELTGAQPAEMCIFGDRLYTDIALGKQNGVFAALVLTGETKSGDLEKSELQPDIVIVSLADAPALTW
ncbi:MAG: HAD-IIA family hydrolase [Clostridiales bacterium]|nr:HAD-IIA family hydrolase [Clostridiales bacterium]